jgi:hypothetical protein
MNLTELTLYNNYHNGDVFYSRVIVRQLLKRYNIKFHHNNAKNLFEDLLNVTETIIPNLNTAKRWDLPNGLINTWIGSENLKFLKINDCSFESMKPMMDEVLNFYNLPIPDESECLPKIEFQNLKHFDLITNEMSYLSGFEKVILVCNNNVMSSQSSNFSFDPVIDHLSENFRNYLFITSSNTSIQKENVVNVRKFTKSECDLLEIGLISTKCDVIVGRASGPFCFTHISENLLNDKKTYISFTDKRSEGVWYNNSKAKQVWSNNYDINNIINTISSNI